MRWPRLTIIGVGLIGGSLALALKRAGVCTEIVGSGSSPASLRRALELGVIDRAESALGAAVSASPVIVIAAPLGRTRMVLDALAPVLEPGAVVTDVGSVKASVIADARDALGARIAQFVPGHPIAGTERSGVGAAFAELFDGHRVILTPVPETATSALAQIRALWEQAGAVVEMLEPRLHDAILAATSHLPHALAYALVDCLAAADHAGEMFRFAAGGFRDFTRIASSDPQMWRDILLANRDAVLRAIDSYDLHLGAIRDALRARDGDALLRQFRSAKAARDQFAQRYPAVAERSAAPE